MEKSLKESIISRRTNYTITDASPITDQEIEALVSFALTHVPSAFNSQSTRLVLLLGEQHKQLWQITKDTLQKIVPPANFPTTESKINSFAAGHGTILFFEDEEVVESLRQNFPIYADNFTTFSQHTSAMHQFAIWTLLCDAGFGCSLQHYNPLIDNDIQKQWNLPTSWHLIAQMPFGVPSAAPTPKTTEDLDKRMMVLRG